MRYRRSPHDTLEDVRKTNELGFLKNFTVIYLVRLLVQTIEQRKF